MKKIIFGMMALAAFTGCNEDYEDWAAPQTNQQVDPLTINVDINETTTDIDMNHDTDKSIALFDYVSDNEAITGFTADVIIDGRDTIPGTCRDGQIFVEANDVERVVALRNNEHKATTYGNISVKVDVDAHFADGDAVYFNCQRVLSLTVAGIPAGTLSATVDGAEAGTLEQKANGTYSITVTTTEDNSEVLFKIVDNNQNEVVLGNYVEGNTSSEGVLATGNSAKGILIPTAGTREIILDIANGTYAIYATSEPLFYTGDANGWSFSPMAYEGPGLFTGFYQIYKIDNDSNWGFKFTTADNWDEPQYGWSDQGADHIALGGGNLDLPDGYDSGFYKIKVNTATLTYELTPITSISIVGDAVNRDEDWGTDMDLAYDSTERCWTGTVTLNAGSFKFRANHGWDISWGGEDPNALTSNNGANLSIDADGTYTIKFWPNCDGKGVYTIE